MIEKIKRPQQFNNQEMQIPRNIQELMQRYDLDSNDIRDYLDYLITQITKKDKLVGEKFNTIDEEFKGLNEKFATHIVTIKDTNLDDYITEGRYYFGSSYTPKDIPSDSNGLLEVFVGINFIKQIWYAQGTPNNDDYQTFVRTQTSLGWSNWKQYAVVEDTEWQNATLTDKFEIYNSGSACKYRKIGKVVSIQGLLKPKEVITGGTSGVTMFTLPNYFHPSSSVYSICQGSGTNRWLLTILPSGEVQISRYSNNTTSNDIPSGAWLAFSVTYLVD